MSFSRFGTRFSSGDIGINRLMEDLANGMAAPGQHMLGGGNPGYVPQVLDRLQQQLADIAADSDRVRQLLADYSLPVGDTGFRRALAKQLGERYGWDISEDNIALTNGSQTAFFTLFNMFAGDTDKGKKHILLPLVPEYIGYEDTGVNAGMFRSIAPRVEIDDTARQFKYRVDWDALRPDSQTGAICVSRPCNPSGNVITDDELNRLHRLAHEHSVPLIVDNAYGEPFPQILFAESRLFFDEQTILVFSLSKFGLPASRTGIILASEKIIKSIATANGVLTLAPSAIGARLVQDLVTSGEIFTLSEQAIRPFYQVKAQRAKTLLADALKRYPCYLHRVEGGMFLWLWCKDLPCSDRELYQRLLERSVTIVPGSYFFPGFDGEHPHQGTTIRISYAGDDAMVDRGLSIIADEISMIYEQSCRY